MLQASLFSLYYKEVYVRAVLSRNGEEYASTSVLFTKPGTKSINLDVSSVQYFPNRIIEAILRSFQ